MSKIRDLLKYGQEMLEAKGKDGASFDSRALLSFVMDIPFRDVPLRLDSEVTEEQEERFHGLLGRRLAGEPLQYITGEQEFMGLSFHVDERVLIPRLDTEILAEETLAVIAADSCQASACGSPEVLDLCCGSGAIGLSIAALAPETKVTLTDISEDALEVAKLNARTLNVEDRVTLVQSDLFEKIQGGFDLIVSNPPYVRSDIIPTLDTEVKDHEPMLALDGGADGLDIYKKIAEEAADHLNDNGCLMMEIGFDQAEVIKKLLGEDGRYTGIQIKKDLAGLDRVAVSKKQG